jgi:hypothetical protein
MTNNKSFFITLRKPLFCLLAFGLILTACVLVSFLLSPRTGDVRALQIAFPSTLSEEDYETLRRLRIVISNAKFSVIAAREKGESFKHIVNDENLREAMDLTEKIISSVDSRIVMPPVCSVHLDLIHTDRITVRNNTCRGCVGAYIEDLGKMERMSSMQFYAMGAILHDCLVIHEAQADIDSMLQSLLLLESLYDAVQLDNVGSCIILSGGYSSIIRFSRSAFEICPTKAQLSLEEVLERVKCKLSLAVRTLVHSAKSETLFAYPLLLKFGNRKDLEEAMAFVAYYDDIIVNMPAYFDLENGPLFDVGDLTMEDILDIIGEDLVTPLRMKKLRVQTCRDRYASFFQRISHLVPESPEGEE